MHPAQLCLAFLKEQEILTIATVDEEGKPWVTNVFHCVDDHGRIFFVSNEDTAHGAHLAKNEHIAFGTAVTKKDHRLRRGVQGEGVCHVANAEDTATGTRLHNERFTEFRERLTVEYLSKNTDGDHVYVIEPKRMKYWDDEEFGPDESREITC